MRKITFTSMVLSLLIGCWHSAFPAPKVSSTDRVTAYLLLADDPAGSLERIEQAIDNPDPTKKTYTNRLVISFMNPNMNPQKIKEDGDNLQELMLDSGLVASTASFQGDEGQRIKNAITKLEDNHVKVFFAIGGWAYSSYNAIKKDPPPIGSGNFPLPQEIVDYFSQAHLATNYFPTTNANPNVTGVQRIAPFHLKDYTDAWINAARAFGATGIDIDYEENWFAAETTFYYKVRALKDTSWGGNSKDGPFVLPYTTIKYASYIKSAQESAIPFNMKVTIAAPAAGAFNIHQNGNGFWCPIQHNGGNACDEAPTANQDNYNVGGNLKGVFYDMAHYQEINSIESPNFTYPQALFEGLLDGVDAINVMTYDLDDGYDTVNASWCIGKIRDPKSGQSLYVSRDPNAVAEGLPEDYAKVDCSIVGQSEIITNMYSENVIKPLTPNQPHLGFGIEAGFPNYPINIDPSLPGGGNAQTWDAHYRWNDPFVVAGLAFKAPTTPEAQADMQALSAWVTDKNSRFQLTDDPRYGNTADTHSGLLIINQPLITRMKNAGADSMILWSLDNADYNQHLSKTSWDYQQFMSANWTAFGQNYRNSQWGYTSSMIERLFNNVATPEEILKSVYDASWDS